MPKVFLSVASGSDDGEAARFFEHERVPFEVLPFGERSFAGWLADLKDRSEAGDVAIAIFDEPWFSERWSAETVGAARTLYDDILAKRIVFIRSQKSDSTFRSNASSVADLTFTFQNTDDLRALLLAHAGHLRGQAPPPRPKPPRVPPVVTAGVEGSGVADEVSAVDLLGFEPYVNAVAAFLTHPNTPAPLTMSIEGPWGSGKSSFMRQLEAKLTGFRTFRFNAWRHEKAEELWAAFALSFIEGIKPKGWWKRWRAETKLTWRQFDLASGWPDLLRVLVWFLALALATMTLTGIAVVLGPRGVAAFASRHATSSLPDLLESWLGPVLGAGGWLVAVGAVVTLWERFFARLKSPLEIDLRKYLRRPDYASKLTFLDRFQQDLRDATDVYLGDGKKVFVFMDDLDRCELPQAAELMRAINLMLSDSGPIVFVIGMDREKIAAALAVKHEKLLPYLAGDMSRGAGEGDTLQGIFFGYEFIEKFIQIPFAVPEPTAANIDNLLASMRTARVAATPESSTSSSSATVHPSQDAQKQAPRTDAPAPPRLHDFIMLREETAENPKLVRLVAPALGNNPRRIKQFINVFRLRVRIAFETDLFAALEDAPVEKRVTLEKLAKFTAIELRWPLLLAHVESEPELLAALEQAALHRGPPPTPRLTYWSAKPDLMALFRAGFDDVGNPIDGEFGQWSLAEVDVAKLTRVSVRQPRPEPRSEFEELAERLKRANLVVTPSVPAEAAQSRLSGDRPHPDAGRAEMAEKHAMAPEPAERQHPEIEAREQMEEERRAAIWAELASRSSLGRDYDPGDGPGIDLPNFITGKHDWEDDDDEPPPFPPRSA